MNVHRSPSPLSPSTIMSTQQPRRSVKRKGGKKRLGDLAQESPSERLHSPSKMPSQVSPSSMQDAGMASNLPLEPTVKLVKAQSSPKKRVQGHDTHQPTDSSLAYRQKRQRRGENTALFVQGSSQQAMDPDIIGTSSMPIRAHSLGLFL